MTSPTAVSGSHRLHLRIEGAVVFVIATIAWSRLGGSWGLFAACFLIPDLSLVAYLAGPRAGAFAYNAAHALVLPGLVAGAGLAVASPAALLVASLWFAHIGLDRALGYGLKAAASFADTHLGRVGRSKQPSAA